MYEYRVRYNDILSHCGELQAQQCSIFLNSLTFWAIRLREVAAFGYKSVCAAGYFENFKVKLNNFLLYFCDS